MYNMCNMHACHVVANDSDVGHCGWDVIGSYSDDEIATIDATYGRLNGGNYWVRWDKHVQR